MPGRSFSAGTSYRYGFNGKENDNEVKGEGAQQDYGMRIYDPRVGRFLSVDPLSNSFPWYTPYQFAGNKPIWALDLDGAEEWYYYNRLRGWTKSKNYAGPYTEEASNKLGYYSATSVHRIQEEEKYEKGVQERAQVRKEAAEAVNLINRLNNPAGIALDFNPVKAGLAASDAFDKGQYLAATIFAVGAFSDLNPLLDAYGKEFTSLSKSLAAKYTIEQTWKMPSIFRGILIEARLADSYVAKGFEWMAETSKFFQKFDFYDATKKLAISLKTVNATKNFDFKNILKNIDELATLKRAKAMARGGVEYTIDNVQLDIAVPKGYNQSNLQNVKDAASNAGVNLNIFEH